MFDKERKYHYTTGSLIDRLVIAQLKELMIPNHREEYTAEIRDIVHDLNLMLEGKGELIRDVIVLTIMNREIWLNESNCRNGSPHNNDLFRSHGLNSIRCQAIAKIQERIGERKEYKIDVVKPPAEWIPSDY